MISVSRAWLDLSPVAWIGAINISGMLLTTAALGILRRRVDTSRGRAIADVMLTLTALLVGCLAAFALAPGLWWSIPVLWLIRMTREMNGTLYTTWVNQRLEAKGAGDRALHVQPGGCDRPDRRRTAVGCARQRGIDQDSLTRIEPDTQPGVGIDRLGIKAGKENRGTAGVNYNRDTGDARCHRQDRI